MIAALCFDPLPLYLACRADPSLSRATRTYQRYAKRHGKLKRSG